MDILLTFAEVSIAVAGFAAVVISFVDKTDKTWNKHMFQGLIGHSMMAFLFSCLPFLLLPFFEDEGIAWRITSSILGSITFLQIILIQIVDKQSPKILRLSLLIHGLPMIFLQVLNITESFFQSNYGPVALGVFWHLAQAGVIFSYFIWEGPTEKTNLKEKKSETYNPKNMITHEKEKIET
jgi:hypothetical protein